MSAMKSHEFTAQSSTFVSSEDRLVAMPRWIRW